MSATYSQMAQKKIGIFSLFLKFLCKFEFLWYLQKKTYRYLYLEIIPLPPKIS